MRIISTSTAMEVWCETAKWKFLSKASDSGYDDVTAAIDCCGFVCQCGNSELGAVTSEQSGVIMSLSLL